MTSPARPAVALALPVASAFCFGFSGPLAKALMSAGWTAGAASVLRCAGAAAVLTLVAVALGRRRSWPGRAALWYGVFAVALAQTAFFLSLARMPVGVTLMIQFLAPVVVIGWERFVRRIPQPPATLVGAALAIGGAVLVIDPFGSADLDPVGVGWAFASMVGQVGFFLLSSGEEDADPLVFTVTGLLVGAGLVGALAAAGLVPFAVSGADVLLRAHEMPWWAAYLPLAVVATALAYLTGVAAVAALGSTLSSVILLSEVVFAVLAAWWLLGETIAPIQCLGGVVLVAGVALARWRTAYAEEPEPEPEPA
ncbi:EamA family transporter [Nocardia thailandica]